MNCFTVSGFAFRVSFAVAKDCHPLFFGTRALLDFKELHCVLCYNVKKINADSVIKVKVCLPFVYDIVIIVVATPKTPHHFIYEYI